MSLSDVNRREFLKIAAGAGAASLALPSHSLGAVVPAGPTKMRAQNRFWTSCNNARA